MTDSLIASLTRAVDAVEPLVTAVTAADHARPTPCPEFDLGALTAHLIGGLRGFADVAEGKPLRFDTDPDLSASVAGAEYRAAADRVIAGFGRAGMIERAFAMPWGETTGGQLVGFELIELLVHGWDIARSLDVRPSYDDELVAGVLAGAQMWVDESVRTPQLFGPEVTVAADATVLDRLVAFLGRDPAWSAPAHSRG